MTARETRRWADITDDSYVIIDRAVRHVAKVWTVGDTTTVIFSTGQTRDYDAHWHVELANPDEIADFQRERDRLAVCRALSRLGSRIVDDGLPVPPGGRGIVVSFDLADDDDLRPWAEYLSARPQRGTSRPVIQAVAEGVEVYVYGPGTSGEFGPDLADAAITEAERRDAVGAFPVAGCEATLPVGETMLFTCRGALGHDGAHYSRDHEHEWVDREQARAEEPERDGFAPPSGHATQATDALQYDGRYNNGESQP